MTQPTREQIEAARSEEITEDDQENAKECWEEILEVFNNHAEAVEVITLWMRKVRHQAALIAAAEVDNKTKALMASGLDALASVGIDGHAAAVAALKKTTAKLIEAEKREAATIERCARVAESWARLNNESGLAVHVLTGCAAAIRALKDKP